MREICSAQPARPTTPREPPTHVRVQSTLLPSEERRKDAYHIHKIEDGDSIQKLAIKFRVSVRLQWRVASTRCASDRAFRLAQVAAIKAANKMITDDVIAFGELMIPKQRNGPERELSRMVTVLASVSWRSFKLQLCGAHGLPPSESQVTVQCLSKVQKDKYGHQMWVPLQSTEELAQELLSSEDANSSKDFLRVRLQEKQAACARVR